MWTALSGRLLSLSLSLSLPFVRHRLRVCLGGGGGGGAGGGPHHGAHVGRHDDAVLPGVVLVAVALLPHTDGGATLQGTTLHGRGERPQDERGEIPYTWMEAKADTDRRDVDGGTHQHADGNNTAEAILVLAATAPWLRGLNFLSLLWPLLFLRSLRQKRREKKEGGVREAQRPKHPLNVDE